VTIHVTFWFACCDSIFDVGENVDGMPTHGIALEGN